LKEGLRDERKAQKGGHFTNISLFENMANLNLLHPKCILVHPFKKKSKTFQSMAVELHFNTNE
jgi:hypothetical protein